jgi:hypothetical protein
MLRASVWSRIIAVVLLGVPLGGCEVVGGIFKAGVWVGALAVIAIIVLLVFVVAKVKG